MTNIGRRIMAGTCGLLSLSALILIGIGDGRAEDKGVGFGDSGMEGREGMTIDRFRSIVLKLGNKMFVRHYLWLNYPNPTQLFGFQIMDPATLTLCRATGRLAEELNAEELKQEGLRFEAERGMWVVERDEK